MNTQKNEIRCPHCNGELKPTEKWLDYQYECLRCHRGWKVEENIWKALFDAGGHIYKQLENGEFEDITP